MRATCVIGLMLLGMVAACSFDDSASAVKRCERDEDCPGQRCYEGFCIASVKETSSSPQLGTDGGSPDSAISSGGRGGSSVGSGGKGGQSGNAGSGGRERSDAGAIIIPADAAIGSECGREGEERPCLVDPEDTISAETCNRGMQTCIDGAWSACVGQPMPEPETCNGLDDDCNGEPDDLVETCYPEGQRGCRQEADGSWTCTGACGTGTRTCRDGALTDCVGATVPSDEICTPENAIAQNEDCDDQTDEGCECRSGETRSCWSGRADRMNVGRCRAGTQTCENGAFGPCVGEIDAERESCANPNVDDDCNGVMDDVPSLGSRCQVSGAQGPCATGTLRCAAGSTSLVCVSTNMPASEVCNGRDDDCDGRADEGFNLRTDEMNCGRCGTRCSGGDSCCAGECVDTRDDDDHCGACGERCANGTRCRNGACMPVTMPMAGMPAGGSGGSGGMSGAPAGGAGGAGGSQCSPACAAGETCCNGNCVDLMNDPDHCGTCDNACDFDERGCCGGTCVNFLDGKHCGACDVDCSLLLNDDGLTCMCLKDEAGDIGCRGSILNLQLCLL